MKLSVWHDSEQEKKQILDLISRTFGNSEFADPSYYDWIYRKNSQGKPLIILANDEENDDAIIGMEPIIPMKLIIEGNTVLSSLSCNSAVNPNYRGRGIFSNLISSISKESAKKGFVGIYGVPNKNSYGIFMREGFEDVTRLPLLVRPLKLSNYFNSLLRSLLRPFDSVWKVKKTNVTIKLLEDRFSEDFETLIDKASKRIAIMQKRDKEFLNWRYKDHPTRDYKTFILKEGSTLGGYIITRKVSIKGKNIGVITDFLVDSELNIEKLKDLVNAALIDLWKDYVSLAIATCRPGLTEYDILRKSGFILLPGFLKPEPLYFIVKTFDNNTIFNKLKSFENWFFSFGDYDVF